MQKNKPSFGFTLVELLVYMGIFSILVFVLTDIFASILSVQLQSQSSSSVEQDNQYLVTRLAYDLHRATSVTLPNANGSSGNTLQMVVGGTNYQYGLTGKNFVLTSGPSTYQLNGYNTEISNLNFQRLGNPGGKENALTVSFLLTSKTAVEGASQSANIITTLSLRRN